MTRDEVLALKARPAMEVAAAIDALVDRRFAQRPTPPTPELRRLVREEVVYGLDAIVSQPWVEEYKRTPAKPFTREEQADLRSAPKSLHALIARFPIGALVRSKPGVQHYCPLPGTVGIVASYSTNTVEVVQGPQGRIESHCDPSDLEVVFELPGRTGADLRRIFGLW